MKGNSPMNVDKFVVLLKTDEDVRNEFMSFPKETLLRHRVPIDQLGMETFQTFLARKEDKSKGKFGVISTDISE